MAGITGSITNSSAGYTISTVCPVDWALAYGDPPSVGFVRKSGGGSTITITDGASAAYTTTDYYHPAAVTWTGGDPVSSGTESWSFTSTNGARVVFPADTTERVVRIYWGTYYDGTSPAIDVTATLSDASAGPWEPANHSVGSGTDGAGYIEITYSAGSAAQTLTVTIAGVDAGSTALTRLQAAGTISSTELASRDQEGFRFGVDDDIESAHTWAAAQDANLTAPLDTNTLLRVLVDATGDPASTAYTLRYQKGGAGGYVAVPVGASATVSPPQVTSATVQSITTANASWALTNGRPAASAGDMIVAVVAWDDSTAVATVTPPAGPNSESAVSIAGPIASASTEMRMQAWYWIATGSWTLGNWTYTPAASETCRQAAFVIPAGQFNAADPIGWANTRASTGTAESTLNSPTGTAEANDGSGRLFIAYGSDADAITAPASGTTTVSNGTTGGVGLCIVSRDTVVANSETITAISATITSDSWAALGFVVKPKVTTNELYVSASANIAAGGEATTARLTAPSGKTTSDFVTGRRWDDENGTDTIDITADDYTELEWCLKAVSPAEDDDYYEFRVYAGTSALDTYTVTPKWTIGGGSTYDDTLTESVTAGQSFTNTAVFVSGVLESATVGDAYAAALTAPAALSESASLGDAFVGAAVQSATLTEDVESGESMAVAAAFVASLSDAATLADGYAPANMMPASLSESVTVADDYAPALTISVTLVESATLDDGVTTGTIYSDDLTESVTAADGYSAVLTITATVTESVTAADAYSSVAVMAEALAEALAPSDSFGAALTMSVQLGESSTLGDGYADQHQQSGTDSVTESVTVGDSYDVQGSFADVLIESAELGDTFTAELVIPVTVGEFVSLADAYESARIVTADLDESVAVADSVVAVLQAIEMLAEDVALDDSLLGTISGTLAIDMPHTRRVGPRVMSFGITRVGARRMSFGTTRVGPRVMSFGITRVGARRMSFGTTRVGPRRMQFGVRRIGPRTIKGD